MIGLGFLVFMFLACFVGANFAPDPNHQNLLEPTSGPSAAHWFGTDELSRDSLSRVLHGGQISLKVALGVAVLSTFIGVVIGALAGFYRGWLDGLLMRFTDLWIALPALPFLAVAVSIARSISGPFGSVDLGGPLGITLLLVVPAVGLDRARRARRDPCIARARVRRRAARVDRCVEHAHHHAARDPELSGPHHRERDARRRRSDPGGEHAVVPRVRHPAAHAELGELVVRLDRHGAGLVVAHGVSPASPSSSPCSRSTSWATACATRSTHAGGYVRDRRSARGRRSAGRVRSVAGRGACGAAGVVLGGGRLRRWPWWGSRARARASPALAIMGLIDPPVASPRVTLRLAGKPLTGMSDSEYRRSVVATWRWCSRTH